MTKNPKITVIIPVYNAEKYIERCLDSILRQTYQDFLILAINDGSTDKSDKILREYVKNFPNKINYIKQKNMGVAKTRNKGIKLAKSEFLTFIDNDDFIDSDYLEKLVPRKDEEIVISGFKRPDENGKVVREMRLKDALWSRFMNPTPWAKIYRRNFVVDNKLGFLDNDIGEDVYFNLLAMIIAKKVKIISYTGYNWFLNKKSVSSTAHKNFSEVDIFKLLNCLYDEASKRGLLEENYQLLEFFFYRFIVWFLLYASKGQKKKAIDKEYKELFSWLSERFPNYRKNKLLRGKLLGEEKKTRIAYKTFSYAQRIGFGEALISLYAKI